MSQLNLRPTASQTLKHRHHAVRRSKGSVRLQNRKYAGANVEPGAVQLEDSGRYSVSNPGKGHEVGQGHLDDFLLADLLPLRNCGMAFGKIASASGNRHPRLHELVRLQRCTFKERAYPATRCV